ncbi:RIKEN cDNA 4933417O08 [Mus musculus]|nr:RIKEN cDNA 4933417O08 [Mus musculus]
MSGVGVGDPAWTNPIFPASFLTLRRAWRIPTLHDTSPSKTLSKAQRYYGLLLVSGPISSLEIWGDGCPGSYSAAPKAVTFLSSEPKVLSALPRSTQL